MVSPWRLQRAFILLFRSALTWCAAHLDLQDLFYGVAALHVEQDGVKGVVRHDYDVSGGGQLRPIRG